MRLIRGDENRLFTGYFDSAPYTGPAFRVTVTAHGETLEKQHWTTREEADRCAENRRVSYEDTGADVVVTQVQ